MITYLLYKLIEKYLNNNSLSVTKARKVLKKMIRVFVTLMLCIVMFQSFAQESIFEYEMIRNNKVIGYTIVRGKQVKGKVTYRISSVIRINLLKDFLIKADEEAVYEKGIMVSSSVLRTINGDIKEKNQTRLIDSIYQIEEDGKKKQIKIGLVNQSIFSLYLNEPIGKKLIYSDNYHRWLQINPIGLHSYKITLPDGNYTHYHFHNGICTRIDIYQTLFNLSLNLKNRDQARVNVPISASY